MPTLDGRFFELMFSFALFVSSSPTYHPTLHGDPFVLRGRIWYDRNGNGYRDSNVEVLGMGGDVEFTHGLG